MIQEFSTILSKDKNNFSLLVLGDLHIGDKLCNYKLIKKAVDYIASTPDVYAIVNGDVINNCIIGSKSDPFSETMSVNDAIDKAVEILTPIKDKILLIACGNHERRTVKMAGLDPTAYIALRLGLEDKYATSSYLVNVKFGVNASNKKSYNNYNIFGTHGARGGGRTTGSVANTISDLAKICCNADLYLKSHTHQSVMFPEDVYEVTESGKLKSHTKMFFNSNAFLFYGGYAQVAEYKPSNTDIGVIRVQAIRDKEGMRFLTSLNYI